MSKEYEGDDIARFVEQLVSANILSGGEARTIALTFRDGQGRPKWGAVAAVAATRVAHKRFGPES